MPDPFELAQRRFRDSRKRTDYINQDDRVGKFELSQPTTRDPLTRRDIGVRLHRIAADAGVLGTVYERRRKEWKVGCSYVEKVTLHVAVHGTGFAISAFLEGMREKRPSLHKLVVCGSVKIRTVASFGGKPGYVMVPPGGQRYTKFGRRAPASS